MTGERYDVPTGAFSDGCLRAGDRFYVRNCRYGRSSLTQTAVPAGANAADAAFSTLSNNQLISGGPGNQAQPGHTDAEARARLGCR